MRGDSPVKQYQGRLGFGIPVRTMNPLRCAASIDTGVLLPRSLQTVEANNLCPQRLREFDDLEISHPSRPGLDSGNRETVDVPSLSLASRRQLLLGQAVVIANSSNLFANHVFSLGHLCAYEHRTLAEGCAVVCARTRNNVVDGATPTTEESTR